MAKPHFTDLHELREKYEDAVEWEKLRWVDVNMEQAEVFMNIHRSSEYVANFCRQVVLGHLGNKVEFTKGGIGITPKDTFKDVVEMHWNKLPESIYDVIFTLGLCPLKFVPTETGDYYPVVPIWGSYKIQQLFIGELEKYVYRVFVKEEDYIFKRLSTNTEFTNDRAPLHRHTFANLGDIGWPQRLGAEKDMMYPNNTPFGGSVTGGWMLARDIIVLSGFGMDPDRDGNLTTPMKSIIPIQDFTALQSAILSTHQLRQLISPLFVKQTPVAETETAHTTHAAKALDAEGAGGIGAVARSYVTEDGSVDLASYLYRKGAVEAEMSTKTPAEKAREQERLASISTTNKIIQDVSNMTSAQAKIFFNNMEPYRGRRTDTRRIMANSVYGVSSIAHKIPSRMLMPLPEGMDLVPGYKLEAGAGRPFLEIIDKFEEALCGIYGMSIDLIFNRGYTTKDHSIHNLGLFMKQIDRLMTYINEVLSIAYSIIYERIDGQYSIIDELAVNLKAQDIYNTISKHEVLDWIENGGVVTLTYADGFKLEELANPDDKQKKKNMEKLEEALDKRHVSLFDPEGAVDQVEDDGSDADADADETDDEENPITPEEEEKTRFKAKRGRPLKRKHLVRMEEQKVEVKLATDDSALMEMVQFMYAENALLPEEYWTILRSKSKIKTDKDTMKKLMKWLEKRQNLGMPPSSLKAGQKKSSSGGASGKGGKHSGKSEASKQRDKKRSRSNYSEANVKRQINASKVQSHNAATGRAKGHKNK